MRQRVMIAIAISCKPKLLLADEPTTALDVTIQDQILSLLLDLQADEGMAMLLVSHDLGVIAQTCDRVCVMYGGYVVEESPAAEIFDRSKHPYTAALLRALPELAVEHAGRRLTPIPGQPPDLVGPPRGLPLQAALRVRAPGLRRGAHDPRACRAGPLDGVSLRSGGNAVNRNGGASGEVLLTVEDLQKGFPVRQPLVDRLRRRPRERVVAVDGVSLEVRRGDTLGIVGESGSGKTTLARLLLRLLRADAGSIRYREAEVTSADGAELRRIRRQMQMVFQDPYSSLNPRLRIGAAIAEPAVVHGVVSKDGAHKHVAEMLSLVGLPATAAERYPRQLSGGQRQRVAIARALSVRPEFLIADEPVSALDASIQAQILNLFDDLLQTLNLTTIFIAHQLSVVGHISNRVAIMYLGRIVETGPTARVFASPQHPYTAGLLAAAPRPDPSTRHRKPAVRGDIPSPLRIPSGCRFRTRCAFAIERCALEDPALLPVETDRLVACHVLPFRTEAQA